MNEVSKPPPSSTFIAAAGGGFVGAVAGAIVAASIMGSPDDSDTQGALKELESGEPAVVAVAER